MIYRAAIVSTIFMASLGFATPAYAEAWTVKGTCSTAYVELHCHFYGVFVQRYFFFVDYAAHFALAAYMQYL